MTVKYVVSIAGELLYFDADRQPTQALDRQPEAAREAKPSLKLTPAKQHPAAAGVWDQALASYSPQQRASAEISEVF